MRILVYRWKAYNQYDLFLALAMRGHKIEEIPFSLSNYEIDEEFARKLTAYIDEHPCDMVLSVNYFPPISEVCHNKGISYVSWCCDSPVLSMYDRSVFNDVNTIFTFDKLNQIEFETMGARVFYLPLCACTPRTDKTIAETDGAPYACDISFVGSMYRKNQYDKLCDKMPEYLRGYFDAVIALQAGCIDEYLLDDALSADIMRETQKVFNLSKASGSMSDLSLIFETTVLGFKIARERRYSILPDLSKRYEVNVYTDDEIEPVHGKNKGTCDYWSESPLVFNNSKINLNLTITNIRSGIPLRVWDIMGCGGFLLTDYRAEMPMYFKEGEDMEMFRDKAELLDKVRYYLGHEDARRKVAASGYAKVKAFHNYDNRLDEMAKTVRGI